MLFHSSIRKELARSFGATLVVLFTIVLTMLLIRTLGLASKGSVNPEEVMLVLGYTVLGRMPIILTLALFIAIVFTLSRMYMESEMIIWFASGRSLGGFLRPVLQFAWPILVLIAVLMIVIWPWANQQTDDLLYRFERRGDLERVEPGQFQESASGRRVFFIDKDSAAGSVGRNIFISSTEGDGREVITSARSGRIQWVNDQQLLALNNGQRMEVSDGLKGLKVSEFEEYTTQIGAAKVQKGDVQKLKSRPTWSLITEPSQANQGELGWRIGMAITALNFVLIAIAATSGNPRAGRGGNLFFTLFAFVFYYNLLNLGQNWVSSGAVALIPFMLMLHGTVFVLAALWLAKRHQNLRLRDWLFRHRLPAAAPTSGARP